MRTVAVCCDLRRPRLHTFFDLESKVGFTSLDRGASDPFSFTEPSLSGHPAAGWFRAASPSGGQTTLKVVWDVPALAEHRGDGTWEYSLRWLHLPDHTGDTVSLSFDLPPAWRWIGEPPPSLFSLDHDITASWRLASDT